jgi:hypothetical protein
VTDPTLAVIEKRVRRACYLALAALGLIIWSLVQPAPLPVIGAMTVGQVLGTFSLLFFVYAIVSDLRPALAGLRDRAMGKPAPSEPAAAKDESKPG